MCIVDVLFSVSLPIVYSIRWLILNDIEIALRISGIAVVSSIAIPETVSFRRSNFRYRTTLVLAMHNTKNLDYSWVTDYLKSPPSSGFLNTTEVWAITRNARLRSKTKGKVSGIGCRIAIRRTESTVTNYVWFDIESHF